MSITINGEISIQQVISGINLQISERTSYMNLLQREEHKAQVQIEIDQLMVDLDAMEMKAEFCAGRSLEEIYFNQDAMDFVDMLEEATAR